MTPSKAAFHRQSPQLPALSGRKNV
jgi:hypothetical protein